MIKQKYDLPLLITLGIIILAIFSKNSWMYTANSSVDISSFMTTAHVWVNGRIPYKDIFEQKGPLLYFIYALAIKSGLWFRAIWILEVVSLSTTLFLFQKTFYKLSNNRLKINATLILYITALVFGPFFDKGGGTEELSLVFITYLLYLFTKVACNETLKTSEIIIAAIGATLVFWIKYTMIMTYLILIGCYLIYQLRQRNYKTILNIIIINLSIFIAISSIIITYFYYNNALPELIKVYFYDNMFLYTNSQNATFLSKIILWYTRFHTTFMMTAILLIIPITYYKFNILNKMFVPILWLVIIGNFMIFHLSYYTLIILPIFIYLNFITNTPKSLLILINIAAIIVSFASASQLSETRFSDYKAPGEQIAQVTHGSADIIQFGMLDTGIYNVTKKQPSIYYYQLNNIPVSKLPGLYQEPLNAIESQKSEYIVTTKPMHKLFEKSFKHYRFVKEIKNTPIQSERYLIYQRK